MKFTITKVVTFEDHTEVTATLQNDYEVSISFNGWVLPVEVVKQKLCEEIIKRGLIFHETMDEMWALIGLEFNDEEVKSPIIEELNKTQLINKRISI